MLIDAHCHISTDFDDERLEELIGCYARLSDALFVVMSTNHIDYRFVDTIARRLDNVIPSFGVHPWYSHLFTLEAVGTTIDKRAHYTKVFNKPVGDDFLSVLPQPIHFDKHIAELISCHEHHKVACWGEIGLDKLFRVPRSGFYANPEYRGQEEYFKLTNYRVSMDHQKRIFTRQLHIALERGIPVSIHNVKTSGVIHDLVKEELKPGIASSVCLHSYTGSLDTLRLFIKTFERHGNAKFFVSFSSVINNCGAKKEDLAGVLELLPSSMVLSETDVTLDRFVDEGGPIDLLRDIVGALGIDGTLLVDNCIRFLGSEAL